MKEIELRRTCGYIGNTNTFSKGKTVTVEDRIDKYFEEHFKEELYRRFQPEFDACAAIVRTSVNILDVYIKDVTSGNVNGYGYIDDIHDAAAESLCKIIFAITGYEASTKDDIKLFTKNADRKSFDRYALNVVNAYDDMISDIIVNECETLYRRLNENG